MKLLKKCVVIIFFLFPLSWGTASAALLRDHVEAGYTTLRDNVVETWNAPQQYDLYVPVITWHARYAYDHDKAKSYNERPWGAGFGQSRWDEKGNWHSLYVMAFKDSFNKWEPIAGYGWEATWRPLADEKFHAGLGYTVGMTARDNWHYIPVPVLLPMASVGYGPVNFQMTYIPGTYGNGNVYFAWLRFQF